MSYDESEHQHLVYECQPFTVTCKCGATETASQASLEIDGWVLTENGECCAKCVKRIVTYALRNQGMSIIERIQADGKIPFVPGRDWAEAL